MDSSTRRNRALAASASLALLTWLVGVQALPAQAATPRYAGPSGSGTACTQSAPCAFKEAVEGAVAGDEVIVLPGTYGSKLSPMAPPATVVAAVNIHGQPGEARPLLYFGTGLGLALQGSATASDLEIVQTQDFPSGALVVGDGASVSRLRASGARSCDFFGNGTIVSDTVCVTTVAGYALYAQTAPGDTLTLANVTALGTGAFPVIVASSSSGNATINMTNVLAVNGGGPEINAGAGAGGTLTLNMVTSRYTDAYINGTVVMPAGGTAGNITAAPLLDSKLRQKAGSPTIDVGTPRNAPALDVDGDVRLAGSTTDIGADEYVDHTPIPGTGGLTSISPSAASVLGTVDPAGLSTVATYQYGVKDKFDKTTAPVTVPAGAKANVPASLTGLKAGKTYKLRLTVTNDWGSATSAPVIFSTPKKANRCKVVERGTAGNDVLNGKPYGDKLIGKGGKDTLKGRFGDDCLLGGPGNDKLVAGKGNDEIKGSTGNDVISGGPQTDLILGGGWNDTIKARDGYSDIIDCGPGNDTAIVDAFDTVKLCETVQRG